MSTEQPFRVTIDEALCCANGRCYELAPEIFEAKSDGFGQVKHAVVDGSHRPLAERAVSLCPEEAIRINEDEID